MWTKEDEDRLPLPLPPRRTLRQLTCALLRGCWDSHCIFNPAQYIKHTASPYNTAVFALYRISYGCGYGVEKINPGYTYTIP